MADDVGSRPITDEDLNTLLQGPLPGALRPHPATGWMSVVKIDGSLILPPMEDEEPMTMQIGPMTMQAIPTPQSQRVGIIAARVIEVGKLPGDMQDTFDWKAGDTIYMASDRGIEIGDFVLVMIDKVICFVKADEDD